MIVMKPNYKLFCESSPFGSKLKLMDAKRVKSSGCAKKRNLPREKGETLALSISIKTKSNARRGFDAELDVFPMFAKM